jgi:hypothetical protein
MIHVLRIVKTGGAGVAGEHRRDTFLATAIATLLTGIVVSTPTRSDAGVARLALPATADDALFYVQIAREIVQGHGVSFTGVTPTNGFQPLWLGVLLPLAAVFRDRATLLRADAVLFGLLLFLAMRSAARTVRTHGGSSPHAWTAIGTVALGVGSLQSWLSEAPLAAFICLSMFARVLAAGPDDTKHTQIVDGLWIGLAVLARLDQAPVALTAMAGLLFARRSWLKAVLSGAISTLVIAPYFAWNVASFRHFAPISSAIRIGPAHVPDPLLLGRAGLVLAAGAWVTMALLLRKEREPIAKKGLLLGLGVLAQGLAVAVLGVQRAGHWYWAQTAAFVAIFGPLAAIDLTPRLARMRRMGFLFVIALVGAPVGMLLWRRGVAARRQCVLPLAAWASANIPAGSRVLVTDAPGVVAYWTDLSVFAADGLTGDWDFQHSLAAIGVAATLQRLRVGYVLYANDGMGAWFDRRVSAWDRPYDHVTLWVTSTLYDQTSSLLLREADEISRLFLGADQVEEAVLWRLPEH